MNFENLRVALFMRFLSIRGGLYNFLRNSQISMRSPRDWFEASRQLSTRRKHVRLRGAPLLASARIQPASTNADCCLGFHHDVPHTGVKDMSSRTISKSRTIGNRRLCLEACSLAACKKTPDKFR